MPLTDGDHIRGLLGTYCRLIDAGDFVGVGQLMADAVLMTEDGTAIATGADEVAALYAGIVTVHDDGTPGTQHVVANTSLEELDGGAIRARSAYLVFQAVPELPLQPIITGSYVDTFAPAGGWHFVERRFSIGRSGDLTHHLAPGVIG
ncbi:nuclear transport factor 2 family protein [Aeromicrobium panaciterrae]|uniref:nuclear transport factor 2 family protein n=1 Tax=Aeromicrobium panaciterrae TaxID=363861 RepID=UPI0031D1B579